MVHSSNKHDKEMSSARKPSIKKVKKTITLKTLAIRYFVNFNAAIGKTKDMSNHI